MSEFKVLVTTLSSVKRSSGMEIPCGSRMPGTYISTWVTLFASRLCSRRNPPRSTSSDRPVKVSQVKFLVVAGMCGRWLGRSLNRSSLYFPGLKPHPRESTHFAGLKPGASTPSAGSSIPDGTEKEPARRRRVFPHRRGAPIWPRHAIRPAL